MKVFLGGTVNGSKWRDYMMPKLEIDYFNPVVEDWDEAAYQRELHERENCDYCLYVLTPKMTGYYALAEVVDDSYKRPDRTLYCFMEKDEEDRFTKRQVKAFVELGRKVEENGGLWFKNVDEIITFLNSSKNLVSGSKTTSSVFYDIFISYGRRHSKDFATVLNNRLAEMKYNVWFDQNNIPLGVDFQEQINDGITKAHNFVFIISPHSVRSEYCLKEILLAVKLNKRIIPLLHVEPKDDWDKMHPTIGKLNWIYFQEKINDFEPSFEGLVKLIESHKDYVETHTSLLNRAIEWNSKLKPIALLIPGPRMKESETWLTKEFHNTQPPCLPTSIHADFICASKAYNNDYLTDVFMCYSEDETDIPHKITNSLMLKGITTWTKEDVKPGENYNEAARQGIERNINFVFIISEKTCASSFCIRELEYAVNLQKRIIPIEIEQVANNRVPETVSSLYILDYKEHAEANYNDVMSKLVQVISKDNDYYTIHRDIMVKAFKWMHANKKENLLLSGFDLRRGRDWLEKNTNRKSNPPLDIHKTFIKKSDISRPTVFISYIRNESLNFADRLGSQLIEYGYNVWMDDSIVNDEQENEEHKKGIIKADNYLFVVSRGVWEDEVCMREFDFANSLNKRIIPLMYVEPDTIDDAKYPILKPKNFIYFRENRDNYDRSFDILIEQMENHPTYVKQHTSLLDLAWNWNDRKQPINMLPTDGRRRIFYNWLMSFQQLKKVQNPPALLHGEFYNEVKKFSQINTTDLCILYDRTNKEEFEAIYYQVIVKGISVWTNQGETKDTEKLLERAVEVSSKVAVLIPANTSFSSNTEKVLQYALSLKKPVIGVITEQKTETPKLLAACNVIDISSCFSGKYYHNYPNSCFDSLISEINKKSNVYYEQKMLIFEAITWERLKRVPSMQITGKKLENTLEWVSEHKAIVPQFVVEYVDECKTKEDALTHEVFISYSAKNADFAANLNHHLRIHGKSTWFDQQYIKKNNEYEEIVFQGIDNAVNILFIFSADFFNDAQCLKELNYVVEQSKRIIPVQYLKVPDNKIPDNLSNVAMINFVPSESEFRPAFAELLRTLETDREHVQNHAKWLKKAFEWQKNDKRDDLLLRGVEFELATKWMQVAVDEKKSPPVNNIQKEYVERSKKAIMVAARREKNIKRFRTVALVLMAILMIVAVVFGFVAQQKTEEAKREKQNTEDEKLRAEKLAHLADSARKVAISKGYEAVKQKEKAEEKALEAKEAEKRAELLRIKAERETKNAIEAGKQVRAEMKRSDSLRSIANQQREKAINALNEAKEQKRIADSLFILAEAQALAAKAFQLLNDGKRDIAVVLALHSYYMNAEKSGPKQINEIYETLFNALITDENEAEKYSREITNGFAVNNVKGVDGGNTFITAAEDRKVIFWELNKQKLTIKQEYELEQKVKTIAYNGSKHILISDISNKVGLYQLNGRKLIKINNYTIDKNVVYMRFLPTKTNNLMIVVSEERIFVYSDSDNYVQPKKILDIKNEPLVTATIGIDDDLLCLYTVTRNNEIVEWKAKNYDYMALKPADTLNISNAITAIDISKDGKYLAYGTYSGRIEILNRRTKNIVGSPLLGHNSPISSIHFNPDATQLATTSYDHTARLWIVEGKENAIILRHQNWVLDATYNKDGTMLITADYSGNLKLWYTSTELLAKKLCAKNKHRMTLEEFREYSNAKVEYKKYKNNCVDFE